MPNYKMLIEYDGTDFCGWQVQNEARTVQGEIEHALEVLLKEHVRITAAGRTDSGVHALGQIASFSCERQDLAEPGFLRSLNGLTGWDVVIHRIEPVSDDFNARFSAVARQYSYHIAKTQIAVGRKYAHHCFFSLEIDVLNDLSQRLLGTHNFEAFAKPDPNEKHYLCHVDQISWSEENGQIVFRIRANRFLRHMVRRLVGTLLHVAQGKMSKHDFLLMVEQQKNKNLCFTAPSKGLFLEKVYY